MNNECRETHGRMRVRKRGGGVRGRGRVLSYLVISNGTNCYAGSNNFSFDRAAQTWKGRRTFRPDVARRDCVCHSVKFRLIPAIHFDHVASRRRRSGNVSILPMLRALCRVPLKTFAERAARERRNDTAE